MSMLSNDLLYGLTILEEVLGSPVFDIAQIEKVRAQMLVDIVNYWMSHGIFLVNYSEIFCIKGIRIVKTV